MARPRMTIDDFVARIEFSDNCWRWTGAVCTPAGYGKFGYAYAHRVSYEFFVGPIESGYQIDHQCHNLDEECAGGDGCPHRLCVNPDHLEAVTCAINLSRGRRPGPRLLGDVCRRGHSLADAWQTKSGSRQCRSCRKEQQANRTPDERERQNKLRRLREKRRRVKRVI